MATLRIGMLSQSCRAFNIQECTCILCSSYVSLRIVLYMGSVVLKADGYKYKVVYSSRFFGYRYDGL